MQTVEHKIALHSIESLKGRMPTVDFGKFLYRTGELITKAVQLRMEGTSSRSGRKSDWIDKASDVRYVGNDSNGNGSAILVFEAPMLGECAPDKYWQKNLFGNRPKREDTAFDLVADALRAINANDKDSIMFDDGVLVSCQRIGNSFGKTFDSASIIPGELDHGSSVVVDKNTISVANSLHSITPKSQAVKVLGELDMVRFSTSAFTLNIARQIVPCVLMTNQIEKLASHGQVDLLVQGMAIYRPSGKLLRIEVDYFEDGTGKSEVWRKRPQSTSSGLAKEEYRRPQGPHTVVNAFFWTWPGDETEEEFLAA
ncbi:MAG: hypothetical protein L3J82_06355, partial [Planctomycetes bacterium]|nr:hypothetical protein [Planctomycetota bacterium]